MGTRSKIRGSAGGDDPKVKPLSMVDAGEGGTVTGIDEQLKPQIAAMGIREGCRLTVDNRQPLGGPVVIKVGGAVTSISRRTAQGIEVAVER
ncbi:MAG: ferrous iron transport protein A [Methanomassiliicoccales archaeon]